MLIISSDVNLTLLFSFKDSVFSDIDKAFANSNCEPYFSTIFPLSFEYSNAKLATPFLMMTIV